MKLNGPYRFSMDVGVVTADGRNASIGFQLGYAKMPTKENIEEGIKQACEVAEEQLGMKVTVMTKQEYWDYMCTEETGTTFALPSGKDWDDPEQAA